MTAYEEISAERVETLWPEAEGRPATAWECPRCLLIVTNRAAHDDPNGEFRCPSLSAFWF